MLESKHSHECDLRVAYFIVYNIGALLERNIKHVKEYMDSHLGLINKMHEEKAKL